MWDRRDETATGARPANFGELAPLTAGCRAAEFGVGTGPTRVDACSPGRHIPAFTANCEGCYADEAGGAVGAFGHAGHSRPGLDRLRAHEQYGEGGRARGGDRGRG